jgi:hypothetical protein
MDVGTLLALAQQTTAPGGNVSGVINYSVSIGDIASIASFLGGMITVYTRLAERLKHIEVKLDILWDDYRRRSMRTRE